MATKFCVVYVTAPHSAGQKIAKALLTRRLAACVSIVPAIASYYWWKGKIERGRELLLIIKARRSSLADLEAAVKRLHPYEIPEIVALPILRANRPYLNWLEKEIRSR